MSEPAPATWATPFVEIASAVNWPAFVFVVFCGLLLAYLLRLDRDTGTGFRLTHLISDGDGHGYSPSFAYVGTFLIGSWLTWYLAVEQQYSQSAAAFAAMMTGFVAGSVFRGNTAAKERVDTVKAEKGTPEAKPVTIEEHTNRKTEVTSQ